MSEFEPNPSRPKRLIRKIGGAILQGFANLGPRIAEGVGPSMIPVPKAQQYVTAPRTTSRPRYDRVQEIDLLDISDLNEPNAVQLILQAPDGPHES